MPTPDIGVISGTPNTGLENSNVLIRDVDPLLYFLEIDKHPIASMILTDGMNLQYREGSQVPIVTGKPLKKRARRNPTIEHLEDQVELADKYNATAAVTTSDTSLTVSATDDDHFRAGDALLLTNASGQTERVIISSVSSNTLNVTNDDGTTRTAGIAMTTSDKFYRMENVRAEDSTAPAIRTTKRANQSNYLEILSETYGLTKTKRATSDYNGDPFLLEKRKAFSRLMTQLEFMFWFGTKAVQNSTTNPTYSNGGWKYWLETYSNVEIRDMAGFSLTRSELMSFLGAVGRGGSSRKVLVGGTKALTQIFAMGFDFVGDQGFKIPEFGVQMQKIRTVNGVYDLVYEPLFDSIDVMSGSLCVLDFDHIQYNYLSGNGVNLDIHDENQLLADGSLSDKGQYVGQCGFSFETLRTMGWMKNIGM
jgi:hypothetical protein